MITAVVMVGEGGGKTAVVSWVQDARRQAARDLLDQLANQPAISQLVLVTPEIDGLEDAPFSHFVKSQPGSLHVGRTLSEIVEEYRAEKLLYFGGGAAPLLEDDTLESIVSSLERSSQGVFTNNRYASDWAGIAPGSIVNQWQERLPQDNMIGWVLSTEANLPIQSQQISAASRLDIDTPTDLLALQLHPRVKRHLRRYIDELPLDSSAIEEALSVLSTPASQVFIAGRISPQVWSILNKATNCWIRVVSEERGMVSSGRVRRGEVFSLLADYITKVGMSGLFDMLSDQSQAAFIDTRVLMAHHGSWPTRSDRFYSDLGLAEQIEDPWLREFTTAAMEAPIPVVLGGHGLLAGDMLAFCEQLGQKAGQ
jgi:hypothetical protein